MRLFVAIELPEELRRAVARFAAEARQALPERAVRWVPEENLHLTLQFLGETDPEQLPWIAEALDAAAEATPALALRLVGSGRFKAAAWVGVEGDLEPLSALVAELGSALALPPARRPYHAHITIGRFRNPRRSRRLVLPDLQEVGRFTARDLALVKSDIDERGAHYTVVHRAPLSTAPDT